MQKILYVWKSPYPWDVRTEKFCKSLAGVGFKVAILARWGAGQSKSEQIDGYRVERVGYGVPAKASYPLSANPMWRLALKNAVDRFKPDLIINREIFLADLSGKIANKRGIPIIMDMAENYPAAMKLWSKYRKNPLLNLAVHKINLPEKLEAASAPLMNGIATVCEEQCDRLFETYEYPRENTCVVRNTPPKNIYRSIWKISSRKPSVFCHHGRMTGDKNIENLIKGFSIAAWSAPDIILLLAGAQDDFERMKRLAKALPHSDRIVFTGAYKQNALADILKQCDCGVIPYPNDDFNNFTIHNKIFDYIAAAKPLIVSSNMPNARIVREIGVGFDVEPTAEGIAEGILRMRESKTKTYQKNARRAAQTKYYWEKDFETLLAFIRRFI